MAQTDNRLRSHKKEWSFAVCSKMDGLEGVMLSKISQRNRNTVCYHLYVESRKYNKLVNTREKKQTHRYREQTMVTSGVRGKIRLGDWEAQTNVRQAARM